MTDAEKGRLIETLTESLRMALDLAAHPLRYVEIGSTGSARAVADGIDGPDRNNYDYRELYAQAITGEAAKKIDSQRAEIADLRAKLEAAEAELTEVKSAVGVVPTWFKYRPEDWKECLLSIKRKLDEDTTQIVDMIRELRETKAEIAASRDTARLDALFEYLKSIRAIQSAGVWSWVEHGRQWIDDNLLTEGGGA